MLFSKETYVERRRKLRELVGSGLIVLFGNNDSPNNYPSNVYKFRQDSAFLYFFGQHRNGLVGVIDADSGNEVLIGDDIDIDDIVWYGSVTSVAQMAEECGVGASAPMAAWPVSICGRWPEVLCRSCGTMRRRERKGRSDMTAWQSYASPVGELLLAADEEGRTCSAPTPRSSVRAPRSA